MSQMLLFPDPRPLVEQLGAEFFRQAPQRPGIYLMRDRADAVLYVGKAKNLRKRLTSYRVANPDRMPRRHLRLLRAVARIDLEECADESSALARESELLLHLRPRFNRAGTWPGAPRFVCWRLNEGGLALAVAGERKPAWQSHGPFGSGAIHLRAALVRLLWRALEPTRRLWKMPGGWFDGRHGETTTILWRETSAAQLEKVEELLCDVFAGRPEPLAEWVCDRTATQTHPFELAARELDLETVTTFASRLASTTTRPLAVRSAPLCMNNPRLPEPTTATGPPWHDRSIG